MENTSILISMLRQGKTGDEILQILETIIDNDDASQSNLETIDS